MCAYQGVYKMPFIEMTGNNMLLIAIIGIVQLNDYSVHHVIIKGFIFFGS